MAKTRQQKEEEVKVLTEKLQAAKSVVFVSFSGLTVNQSEELRKSLREQEAELKMAKKRLLKIALEKAGLGTEILEQGIEGNLSLAFGFGDEVAPAQVLVKFAKANEQLSIKGGILEGKFIDDKQIKALASLPSRQELLAKVVGTIQAPVSGFVNVLSGNLRNLVYVLNAIKEAKS